MNLKRVAALFLTGALFVPALFGQPQRAAAKDRFIDLDAVPKPKITGAQIIAGLEDFVDRFPLRQSMLPNNQAAAEFLATEAKKNGFKTRILEFEGGTPARPVRVVEAVKRGTKKPNEWIAFIAHYDIVPGQGVTVQGAYDDGTGTNILRYFGKAFKNIKTKRSIALLWFDGEENGHLGSVWYSDKLKEEGKVHIHAGMGFDMVGIGYPANYCICIYHGPAPKDIELAVPVAEYVNFDYLKFPKGDGAPAAAQKWPIGAEGHVCVCGVNIRNSDEQNFAAQGWFTMRWTGMRTANDYPGYHQPWDTVPFMEFVAGSRENLEQGTENTFKSAYYTAMVLDALP